jgi:acetoin utilization deacetylase AcuC-like enzyme
MERGSMAMNAHKVGFCSSPVFVEHQTGPHHPERPDRLRAVARAVRQAGLVKSADPFPEFEFDSQIRPVSEAGAGVVELEPSLVDERVLELVHPARHIERVRRVCEMGGGVVDQGDTVVGPRSFEVAMQAVGAVLRSAEAVMRGEVGRSFAAVRPPGHHAEPDRAMGFCLFSNIAIAARYLQKQHDVGRIAIVDFDVHHGNGTQAAFEEDPTVLFISLHQHPRTIYPGTGYDWEEGVGHGRGLTLNIPMAPTSDDDAYLRAMEERVMPKLDRFRPEVLLISAGFDAHHEDPLAHIDLSEEGFEQMTRMLVEMAGTHSGGRVVSVLEGGYNLRALGRSVVRHLVGLGG